jgi:uncharacterized repeat protein (TIGR03803 family)
MPVLTTDRPVQMSDLRVGRNCLGLLFIVALISASPAEASSYVDIYSFDAPGDGVSPSGSLVMDSQGRLYGTTYAGGAYGDGTVFRLTKPASGNGEWTEEILHSFDYTDGFGPIAGVTLGSDGSVYGTTSIGGAAKYLGCSGGCGVVFKLANTAGWPLTELHHFRKGLQGGEPDSALLFGSDGLLYGTTSFFGNATTYAETGTVYSISPQGGQTDYQLVHAFGKGTDGVDPVGLTAVPPSAFTNFFNGFVGANYQTTNIHIVGAIFAEQIQPGGQDTETVLYTFGDVEPDINGPYGPPTLGSGSIKQALYGTCLYGGTNGVGGVYRLIPNRSRGATETVLYDFGDQPTDPLTPLGQLVQANFAGKLVGISNKGGAHGDGTFFELDPPTTPGGAWTEQVDISFNSHDPVGGANPGGTPLRVGSIYYGTLETKHVGNGAIYELNP